MSLAGLEIGCSMYAFVSVGLLWLTADSRSGQELHWSLKRTDLCWTKALETVNSIKNSFFFLYLSW